MSILVCCLCLGLTSSSADYRSGADKAGAYAKTYADAVQKLNASHARKPGDISEEELAGKLPRKATGALKKLIGMKAGKGVPEALVSAGEAALDLARMQDFELVSGRLAELSPEHARELGSALARQRFVLRGLGGLDRDYLEMFAGVLDVILDGYEEVFGFDELSKVPGKKLRVKIHLGEKITRPPHFEPQFPFHSQVDFPVIDGEEFRSPTADGKFLFYGLCHEIGHVIAMWGDRDDQEDHHAWAHYTGVVLVDHLAGGEHDQLAGVRDERWRSLEGLRKELEGVEPAVDSREGVLALLLALHDGVGPSAIGEAINHLDHKDRRLRINRVRYYGFDELREGLLKVLEESEKRELVSKLMEKG